MAGDIVVATAASVAVAYTAGSAAFLHSLGVPSTAAVSAGSEFMATLPLPNVPASFTPGQSSVLRRKSSWSKSQGQGSNDNNTQLSRSQSQSDINASPNEFETEADAALLWLEKLLPSSRLPLFTLFLVLMHKLSNVSSTQATAAPLAAAGATTKTVEAASAADNAAFTTVLTEAELATAAPLADIITARTTAAAVMKQFWPTCGLTSPNGGLTSPTGSDSAPAISPTASGVVAGAVSVCITDPVDIKTFTIVPTSNASNSAAATSRECVALRITHSHCYCAANNAHINTNSYNSSSATSASATAGDTSALMCHICSQAREQQQQQHRSQALFEHDVVDVLCAPPRARLTLNSPVRLNFPAPWQLAQAWSRWTHQVLRWISLSSAFGANALAKAGAAAAAAIMAGDSDGTLWEAIVMSTLHAAILSRASTAADTALAAAAAAATAASPAAEDGPWAVLTVVTKVLRVLVAMQGKLVFVPVTPARDIKHNFLGLQQPVAMGGASANVTAYGGVNRANAVVPRESTRLALSFNVCAIAEQLE